jgi:hypothetical protein
LDIADQLDGNFSVTNLDSGSPSPGPDWIGYLKAEDIQTLAKSLRQIDPTWTHGSPNETAGKTRIWYQGREPYFDVMLEMHNDHISWFQVTLRGRVLSWQEANNRLATGETEELDYPPAVAYYAASKNIRSESKIDMAFVNLVKQILANRPDDALLITMTRLIDDASSQHV